MKYSLKALDESIKQSENIEDLNNACIYYRTMQNYLDAMPEALTNNKDLFNLLVKQCYNVEQSPVDEPLTPERIQADLQLVNQNIAEYYGIIQEALRSRTM